MDKCEWILVADWGKNGVPIWCADSTILYVKKQHTAHKWSWKSLVYLLYFGGCIASQAGRRGFDPGRPLHFSLPPIAESGMAVKPDFFLAIGLFVC